MLLELFKTMVMILYTELLMNKNEPTIHQQNINVLRKEAYKSENDPSPTFIDDTL